MNIPIESNRKKEVTKESINQIKTNQKQNKKKKQPNTHPIKFSCDSLKLLKLIFYHPLSNRHKENILTQKKNKTIILMLYHKFSAINFDSI